jgi:hypothetical protein
MGNRGRRAAKEWAKLVREWKRSGLSAAEFGAVHGVSGQALMWWRWRLRRDAKPAKEPRRAPEVRAPRLMPVEVVDDDAAAGSPSAERSTQACCAIVIAEGCEVRVFEGASVETVRMALEVARGRSRDRRR